MTAFILLLLLPISNMASTDVKIQGSKPGKFRLIDRQLLLDDITRASGIQDPAEALLYVASTILEGNDKPLGITGNQDISARRASPAILQKIGRSPDSNGRIPLQGIPYDVQKDAIWEDKKAGLIANKKNASPEAIADKYNGEKDFEKKHGKKYSDFLREITSDISGEFSNEVIRRMLAPVLQRAEISTTPSLTPTLDLLKR